MVLNDLKIFKLDCGYTCSIPKDKRYVAVHKKGNLTVIINKDMPYIERIIFKSDMILAVLAEGIDLTIIERI